MRPSHSSRPGIPRTYHGSSTTVAAVFLLLTFSYADCHAQRITYESLRMRDRQPNVFLEHLVIPDSSFKNMSLVTIFRLENNFLSYRRYRGRDSENPDRQFYAEPTVRLFVREFNNNRDRRQDRVRVSRRGSEPDRASEQVLEGQQEAIVASNSWSETVYTRTFEQTQSSGLFIQRMMETPLTPGKYTIESTIHSEQRTRRGITPRFQIPDTTQSDSAYFYFLDHPSELSPPFSSPLMNMGNKVFFGRDHQLAIWIPESEDEAEYKLEIHQLRIQQRDTTAGNRVFEHSFDSESLHKGHFPNVYMRDDRPHFELLKTGATNRSGSFHMSHIPNSRFENAHFRLQLKKKGKDGKETTIARRSYQSLWLDMPVSLLNIDVAIDMMRFIVDDDTHRSLRRGNKSEKERRFREFWAERDPAKETEYNELMVEYFRRIDQVYENFTTPQKPGYESDQGKVYIRHGEPDRRERIFPTNQPTREIWHYRARTYVFEATTGFGDYQLVEQK